MLNRPSKAVVTRVVGIVGALVALSAFLMLSNLPGTVFAQTDLIMYAENSDTPVRTFTSEDPEGAGIDWDVTGVDADDFSISGGVLTFNDPPDFEKPSDREVPDGPDADDAADDAADNNMYHITVRASEMRASGYMGRALSTETDVIVQVTNENEMATVTMNRIQPEVGTRIMAMISDPDGNPTGGAFAGPYDHDGDTSTAEVALGWQWYVSKVTNPVDDIENHWAIATGNTPTAARYTPAGDRVDEISSPIPPDSGAVVDEGKVLRAVARYTEQIGGETFFRMAIGVSDNRVRPEVSSDSDLVDNPANGSPGFQEGVDYSRTVPESISRGMNVGAPVMATDPNSDTLTYELDNDRDATNPEDTTGHVGYFSIDRATGQLKVKKTLDYDMNPDTVNPDGEYMFLVRAIDPSGETAEVEVTVTATAANDGPKIMGSATPGKDAGVAPSELRVNEEDSDDRDDNGQPDTPYNGMPNMAVPATLGNMNVFTATDEDARGQITWSLRGEDADDFERTSTGLSGPDEPIGLRFKNTPDYEMPTDANGDNVYKVTLVATDSVGAEDTKLLTIFVDNVPEQGMATLTETQPTIGQDITAKVEDPDGGVAVVTWQWSKSTSNTPGTTFAVIHRATMATYRPRKADEGYYLQATATYIDTTSEMDDPGTALRDERVQKGIATSPEAKAATAGDGMPNNEDELFRVMVTSENAVREDPSGPPQVTQPQFDMASYDRMVDENAEVGSIVGGPVMVMAEKDVTFTYDLDATTTNDANYFTIDPDHGQIRVGEVAFPDPLPAGIVAVPTVVTVPDMDDPALDYEDFDTFVLVVTATDKDNDAREATARVTILLRDLNESPYFDEESLNAVMGAIMYAEARTNAVVQLAATEPDGASLRWEVTGTDASAFETMEAQDIDNDKDRFELHFKNQPDFEERGGAGKIYSVKVRVTETVAVGSGPNMAAELLVMVQVTNSEEAGKVELNWLQPEVGTKITAILSDPDDVTGSPTWTWWRAKVADPNRTPGAMDADLSAEWEQITEQSTDDYTPQGKDASADSPSGEAVDENRHLLARAQYIDKEGSTKVALGISAYPVQADVADEVNNSPDFNQNKTTRTVPENTAVDQNVGAPVDVDQNEDNDVLTYELDNNNNATDSLPTGATLDASDLSYFSIDKRTGQIKVAKKLDWDKRPNRTNPDGGYTVWVRATDPSGEGEDENRDHIEVTIKATDVNEAPKVSDGDAELSVKEMDSSKKDTDVTKYVGLGYELTTATPPVKQLDPGNPNLYHRSEDDNVDSTRWPEPIAGPDGALFDYSTPSNGIGRRLHFKEANPPDYENPMDDNRDNVYELTIRVMDNSGDVGTKNVRITVMNVDEQGKLELTPEQPDDGMPVMATLTDPDCDPNCMDRVTDWNWAATPDRVNAFPTASIMETATTNEYTGKVGQFLWAMVDYRDGASVENNPVTALDERNDNPKTPSTEQHKFVIEGASPTDMLFHNSDKKLQKVADNAVQKGPDSDGPPLPPSAEPVLVERMVYENVPSTGYVGGPLMGLSYKDLNDATRFRDTIGGPDGASFVLAEDVDDPTGGAGRMYYDMELAPDPDIPRDKEGQLAAAVVTHFDYEGGKREYIIELTDPDAEVAVGPVRVTITVMNVNEAPSAPEEQRGGLSVTGRENVMFDEILADNTSPDLMVGTYRGIGVQASNARWSLSGPDMADFSIDASTGELMFNAAPDFEMPMDADTDNRYDITVEADDGTNTAALPVSVMVVNMDEMGRVTFWRDGADTTDAAIMAGDMLDGAVDDSDGNPGDTFPIEMYTRIAAANVTSWQWAKTMDKMDDASWMDIVVATNAEYEVMDTDAGYYLRARVMYDDGEGMDKMASEMTEGMVGADVTPMPDMTLLDRYNTDGTLGISKAEYLAAADDYFDDIIDKPTLLEVADLYFDS